MSLLSPDADFETNVRVLLAKIQDPGLAAIVRRHITQIMALGDGSTAADRAPIIDDLQGWIAGEIEERRAARASSAAAAGEAASQEVSA